FTMSASTGSTNVHVYPSPFRPTRGDTAITFVNLPPSGVEIDVVTLANEEVFHAQVSGAGIYAWDAKNGEGRTGSSGLYLYHVHGSGIDVHGKLMVTR